MTEICNIILLETLITLFKQVGGIEVETIYHPLTHIPVIYFVC